MRWTNPRQHAVKSKRHNQMRKFKKKERHRQEGNLLSRASNVMQMIPLEPFFTADEPHLAVQSEAGL